MSSMKSSGPVIAFLDNNISNVYKSVDAVKEIFPNTFAFKSQDELFEFLKTGKCDILCMNLDLLPEDAIAVTKIIKGEMPSECPVIVIYSDKQDEFIQELAYNRGADAYVSFHRKPSLMQVFLRNILARKGKKGRIRPIVRGGLVLDAEAYVVYKDSQPIDLPIKEFKIFELLYMNPKKFFTKEEIAIAVWEDKNVAKKRTIDVHVYNIRKSLGRNSIQTKKEKGYRINPQLIS